MDLRVPSVASILRILLVLSLLTSSLHAGDELGDVALTPWWDMTLGKGETLLVDCGVYTPGANSNVTVRWTHPKPGPVTSTNADDRVFVSYKTDPSSTPETLYKVLTLHVNKLTADDSGLYTCESNSGIKKTKTIKVEVKENGEVCGFESDELCGWNIVNSTGVTWHHHSAADSNVKLCHDHTYGLSKSAGHFLDVENQSNQSKDKKTAQITSPEQEIHQESRCFGFWYLVRGGSKSGVTATILIKLSNVDTSGNNVLLGNVETNVSESIWTHRRFNIPPQTSKYQIILEYSCDGDCKDSTVAVDDVHVHIGKCEDVTDIWREDDLSVRLTNENNHQGSGLLEVLHDGEWGTVCSDQITEKDPIVICKQLSFGTQDARLIKNPGTSDAPSNQRIWLSRFGCQGQEANIGLCLTADVVWDNSACTHAQDVFISCFAAPISPTTTQAAATTNKTDQIESTNTSTPVLENKTTHMPTTSTTISSTKLATVTSKSSVPMSTSKATNGTDASTIRGLVTSTIQSQKTSSVPSITANRPPAHVPYVNTDDERSRNRKRNAGAAVAITIVVLVIVMVIVSLVYKRKRGAMKSNYIVFSNPKYQRENLPSNDIGMDSPLSQSGPILA